MRTGPTLDLRHALEWSAFYRTSRRRKSVVCLGPFFFVVAFLNRFQPSVVLMSCADVGFEMRHHAPALQHASERDSPYAWSVALCCCIHDYDFRPGLSTTHTSHQYHMILRHSNHEYITHGYRLGPVAEAHSMSSLLGASSLPASWKLRRNHGPCPCLFRAAKVCTHHS